MLSANMPAHSSRLRHSSELWKNSARRTVFPCRRTIVGNRSANAYAESREGSDRESSSRSLPVACYCRVRSRAASRASAGEASSK